MKKTGNELLGNKYGKPSVFLFLNDCASFMLFCYWLKVFSITHIEMIAILFYCLVSVFSIIISVSCYEYIIGIPIIHQCKINYRKFADYCDFNWLCVNTTALKESIFLRYLIISFSKIIILRKRLISETSRKYSPYVNFFTPVSLVVLFSSL